MALSETQLSSIITRLEQDFQSQSTRWQVRRALIERLPEMVRANQVGTNVPKPFDKSSLIIQTITADAVDGTQHYAARFSANAPQPIVPRVTNSRQVTKATEANAAEQERLLAAMWEMSDGRRKQRQIGWSQAWCRVGWYLTLPRDIGWGLPDRSYFEDLDDEALEKMRASDDLAPEKADDGRWPESAGNWVRRRKDKAREDALSGRALFTLEAIPGDMVRYRFDRDGVKYAYVIEEVPEADFAPGTEFAMELARRDGVSESDVRNFGIYRGKDGKIIAGMTQGGEQDSTTGSGNFNFIRFFDRECVYYLVAGAGAASGAKLVWHTYHGAGKSPLIPAPAIWTDSRRPGAEFSSPMEPVFALQPILNQLETLLSNVATYNATPRWVIEKADGSLVTDEQGNPKEIAVAPTPGMDPQEAQVVEGRLRQLVIDGEMLYKLLGVYLEQMDKARPPDVAQGEGGTSGAAWTVRMLQTAAQADLEDPVGNHAAAVREVLSLWVRWMRLLDVPVYALSIPRNRASMREVRGIIEFDPDDLIDGFEVIQSKDSASDRIVREQHGIEKRREGLIDDRRYFEEYALEADPVQAEKDMWVQQIKTQLMAAAMPQLVQGLMGKVFLEIQKQFPNSAMLTAELMNEQANMAEMSALGAGAAGPMQNHSLPRGNVAEANGIRQPGMGSSSQVPGNPMGGAEAMAAKAGV